MAGRGRPPTPVKLRLVTGVHRTTRHGNAAVALKQAAGFGPLKAEKPQGACAGLLARHDRAGFMAGWVEEARHSAYSSQSISAGARAVSHASIEARSHAGASGRARIDR